MPDLHEKLRRFRATWITCAQVATADPAPAPDLELDADDGPRFWAGVIAAFPPIAEIAAARRGLPRFAYLATQDEGQLAA